jgi:Tfp pilus assembly protein PilE
MPPITKIDNNNQIKHIIMTIIVAVVTVIIIASVVVVGLYFWHKNTLISQVKNDLNKVALVMESNHTKTGAYPASIPDINTKNSKLSGGSSFDGTTYCVSGVSSTDKTIIFHINSTSPNSPQSGNCVTGSDIPIPSMPGNLAVAFATTSNIKLTWNTTPYAANYTLQCATDDQFISSVSVKVTTTYGLCNKLQSGIIYYCRVMATNKKGNSDWSEIVRISTFNK